MVQCYYIIAADATFCIGPLRQLLHTTLEFFQCDFFVVFYNNQTWQVLKLAAEPRFACYLQFAVYLVKVVVIIAGRRNGRIAEAARSFPLLG